LLAGDNILTLKDYRGERPVRIALVTADIAAALAAAELIVIPTPAFAQADIARAIAPHLCAGQVIFLPPGSFGCYVMRRIIRDTGSRADIAIAETGTLPYLTRKHGSATIAITTRATRLPTGVFPGRLSAQALAVVKTAYPAIEVLEDGLSAALMNAGPVIHPPLILMNAGPIEHFEHWDIHNEGTQPSIRRVTDCLDGERVAIRQALGYQPPHFPLADHYHPGGDEWMYGNLAHEKLTGSGDWREHLDLQQHRYMREDIAIALAFLVSVGDWIGVDCPVARGLLALGSAVTGEDFRRSGRTLENLGLAGYRREDLQTLLCEGLR
jgi:opine dehydrogenase